MNLVLELLDTLRRRRALLSTLFILLAVGGAAGAYLKRPAFESSARLLLNVDSMPLSLSRAEVPQIGGGVPTVETVTTLVELLAGRALIEQVVDDLGPDFFAGRPPSNPMLRAVLQTVGAASEAVSSRLAGAGLITRLPPRDALIEALSARLIVYPVRQSQVIEVALRWGDPAIPSAVIDRLLALFLARVEQLNARTGEFDVLVVEARNAAEALSAAQDRLRALQRAHGVVSPGTEIDPLAARITALERAAVGIGAETGEGAGRTAAAALADELARRVSALEIDRARAQVRFAEESVAIREIDAELGAARDALARERARIEAALNRDRARLEALLGARPAFDAAAREIELAANAQQTYRQAADDRRVMSLQQDRLRVRLIEPPVRPLRPTGPSRLALVLVALAFAAILACGLTLLVHRLSTGAAPARESEDGSDAADPAPDDAGTPEPLSAVAAGAGRRR